MLLAFIHTILTRPMINVTTARGRLLAEVAVVCSTMLQREKPLDLPKQAGAVRQLQAKLAYRISRLKQSSGQLHLLVKHSFPIPNSERVNLL